MSENDKLRELFRKNLGIIFANKGATQKELAEYMGVSAATVNDWLKGRKLPRMDKLDKICVYFNVKRSDLMEEHTSSQKGLISPQDPPDLTKFLEKSEVMFDGNTYQLNDADREKIRTALRLAFWDAKKQNKRKKD